MTGERVWGTSGKDCEEFLELNKSQDGVIALASGLQYKVLKHGFGTSYPTADSSCECHYAGRLLDHTEFDSSYKRGKPTAFAPNQVIKGWTEAMQLMVEGDKWEMYIPYNLAYGENGHPPNIPGKAALIFKMEIIKIKDAKKSTPVKFPEWTDADRALLNEKDEEPLKKWRDERTKLYEEGGLRDKHPSREAFDKWLDTQCEVARSKSLWKRTRTAQNAALGPDPDAKPSSPPALTKETGRVLLTKALETFKVPANRERLEGIIKECEALEPAQQGMMKMMKLLPVVQEITADTLKEYGFSTNDLMMVTMQIQAMGAQDATIAADVAKLMKAVQGDLSDLLA